MDMNSFAGGATSDLRELLRKSAPFLLYNTLKQIYLMKKNCCNPNFERSLNKGLLTALKQTFSGGGGGRTCKF